MGTKNVYHTDNEPRGVPAKTNGALMRAVDQETVVYGSVAYYDSIAEAYLARYYEDRLRQYAYHTRKARVLEMLPGEPGKLLDVGCGPGVMVQEVLSRGFEFFGVDASKRMIAESRKAFGHTRRAQFISGDATALPFADRTFDVLTCMGVICRIARPEVAIVEMGRVLKPGGTLLMSFPNLLSPYAFWEVHVFYPLLVRLKRLASAFVLRLIPRMLALTPTLWTPGAACHTLERYVGGVEDVAFVNFSLLPWPFEEVFPDVALRLAHTLEHVHWSWLRRLGAGFIVKARKAV
jgi:ubiquinone/menaquinone biosynthesis C-methylase UbiE